MKTLYIECNMGAAGDMLMAALLELAEEREAFLGQMNALVEGVQVDARTVCKYGITGTNMMVKIDGVEEASIDVDAAGSMHSHSHQERDTLYNPEEHYHHHTGHNEISGIISTLPVSQSVKEHALAIYRMIAEAEAHVHGRPVEQVHFHEVGSKDAIADIVGICLLMERLSPDEIVVSPIHVGSGFVRCAHGVLPVPAPATAHILMGVPSYGGKVKGELCTPTGAAVLKHFATRFDSMPQMVVRGIGYGMGKKDFGVSSCVRAFLGESESYDSALDGYVAQLQCNLDDMTGEAIGFACRLLLKEGARDVFTTPVQMKKDRPGILLTCLCDASKADRFAALMLKHTSTFGVRKTLCSRYTLERKIATQGTPYGEIRIKTGTGYGVVKSKPEYEDVASAAQKHGVSITQVMDSIALPHNHENNE